jgi:hypothetical protein
MDGVTPAGNLVQTDDVQIATLRFEQEVDGVFECVRKERQISRAGTPYLTVELRDSTGTIRARAFRDADVLAGRFERGELVRVKGRVERFRDELQIALAAIARADGSDEDADPARFLPTAYRDLDELEGFLEHPAPRRWRSARTQSHAAAPPPGAPARITRISAACSSTPSRSRRWRSSSAPCTRVWTEICC